MRWILWRGFTIKIEKDRWRLITGVLGDRKVVKEEIEKLRKEEVAYKKEIWKLKEIKEKTIGEIN